MNPELYNYLQKMLEDWRSESLSMALGIHPNLPMPHIISGQNEAIHWLEKILKGESQVVDF